MHALTGVACLNKAIPQNPLDAWDAAQAEGKGGCRLNIVKVSSSRETDAVLDTSAMLPWAEAEHRGSGWD